ncbi:MAG: ABC transporter permease [Rhodospirillales bacterium]|nr:ABC transporter permease [Rhodospirillales bacterium]
MIGRTAAEAISEGSRLAEFSRLFLANRSAMLGATIVLIAVVVALLSSWLAPTDYARTNMLFVWEPPGDDFVLGTDALGRDVFSRLIVGARVSLTIALSVLAIALTVGTAAGMAAAWNGGWIDSLVMRTADITFAFPELIIAILVAAILGPGILTVIISLSLVSWPGIARIVRALVLTLRGELYIDAAIVCGTPPTQILLRHCLPNIVPALIVRASVGVGFIVMAEATLSFLGLGVQEPLPSWGGMIRDGLTALRTDPHLSLAAGAALGTTIIGFNLLGDGLRDLLDPRIRER